MISKDIFRAIVSFSPIAKQKSTTNTHKRFEVCLHVNCVSHNTGTKQYRCYTHTGVEHFHPSLKNKNKYFKRLLNNSL